MSEIIDKAAEEYVKSCNYSDVNEPYSPGEVELECTTAFKAGSEWQAKQSPWISVEERLPIPIIEAIEGSEYGSIGILGAIQNSYGDYDYYICRYWGYNKEYRWENRIIPDYWMPISSV